MIKVKKILNHKRIIIFDLDGVLIDSKANMKMSWNYSAKKNGIKISFEKYFKFIGLPFKKILSKLKIKKKYFAKLKQDFDYCSKKNISKIKPYKFAKLVLRKLKKNKKKVCLLTSKDFKRSKLIIKKFGFKFDKIECGKENIRGKPYPDQLLKILKITKTKKKEAVYIGDMYYDKITANNAKVDFILAKYGYGTLRASKKILKIEDLSELFL